MYCISHLECYSQRSLFFEFILFSLSFFICSAGVSSTNAFSSLINFSAYSRHTSNQSDVKLKWSGLISNIATSSRITCLCVCNNTQMLTKYLVAITLSLHHFQANLFKVNLLFLWIGVVKPHDEFTLEQVLIMLIQQCCLSMANMKVAGQINMSSHLYTSMSPSSYPDDPGGEEPYPEASGGNLVTTFPISAPGSSTNFPTSACFDLGA